MQTRIKVKSNNKNENKMMSTKSIIKFPYPGLSQGCPDWKAGILSTTLMILAGIDNYNIHIGKRALLRLVIRRIVVAI